MFKKIMFVIIAFIPLMGMSKKIIVVSDIWEGYTSEDGSGYYLESTIAALEPLGYEVEFKVLPYARALKEISEGRADIVLGTYEGDADNAIYANFSAELDTVDAIMIPGSEVGFNVGSWFDDKKTVGQIGYGFQNSFGFSGTYKEYSGLVSMIKQLSAKRVDVIIDYAADVMLANEEAGLNVEFEIIESVFSSKIQYGFQNNASGEALRADYDKGMQTLHESGKLREIMIKNLESDATYPL